MNDQSFTLDPVARLMYSSPLADFAIAEDGETFVIVDENGRVMLNGNTSSKLTFKPAVDKLVNSCQFVGNNRQVVFSTANGTYIARFPDRSIVRIPTGGDQAMRSTIVHIGGDLYATISSIETKDGVAGQIAHWSLDGGDIKEVAHFECTSQVNCAAFMHDLDMIVMGCKSGDVLAWSLRQKRIEHIGKVEGAIIALAICPYTGNPMLAQWYGMIAELLLREREIKDVVLLRGGVLGLGAFERDSMVIITNQDVVGANIRKGEFSFWKTFVGPEARSARFSNDLTYVVIDRPRTLEVHRVADMFSSFVF